MIDEEIDQWRFESIHEFQSIKIEDQYDDIESLEYIKHLPLIENFQPFESFNEEGELNSFFDESLLQLSKKTWSKDGTKENLSSKDSVAHHEQNVSIDMNKIVGDLIVTKKTDQKNEKNQRNLKIKNFNSGVSKRTDSKHLNRRNGGGKSDKPEKSKGTWLLYTKIPKLSTPAVPKRTNRWGKAEDKIMFNALISACETKGILFSDLSIEESLTNVSHYEVLLNLKREMRWVGTTKQILQRILKSKHLSLS